MKSQRHAVPTLVFLGLFVLMLWPGVAHAQWTAPANPVPGYLSTCVLLTDGDVMCHEYGTNQWHRLSPDNTGSYVDGTWAPTAPMPNGTDTSTAGAGCAPCVYAPLYYYSGVLPDGRVVVVGGEYNTNGATWTNIGFMYDPVADSWSSQLTVPFAAGTVGDAQGIILDDGTLLLAQSIGGARDLAAFDPNTLTFTALGPTGKRDSNNEEGWNILPDGTVLTVDSRIDRQFEIYDSATNGWDTSGSTVVDLADTGTYGGSAEVGPGVLRPDGTLVYFSANRLGQNAVYNTVTNTWAATPAGNFPTIVADTRSYAVADGVASLLPNGNVLVMASPVDNANPFQAGSHFYEFDLTNTLTAVTDSPNAAAFVAYHGRMLLLPTGEVLLTAYNQGATQDVLFYSNGGAPQNAWRPVITSAPNTVIAGSTYPISGRLFNGFSEGATYGDDAAMSTNYPLVRIRNVGSGHVCYARTHDHSSMGVELITSVVETTTMFTVPGCLEAGPSQLFVVTNGIPSAPITINGPDLTITKTHAPALFTQGDAGDTFSITVTNSGPEPTSGVVTVVDALPAGLTATAAAGPGWTCDLSVTCTRNDVLAAGGSYPDITLTVDVADDAPIMVQNNATVSGGGEAANVTDNNTATDAVSIRQHTTTTVSPASQHYHDEVILSATVTPAGVDGTVRFFLNGSDLGLGTYNSVTGVATLSYVVQLASGSYDLRADFTSAEVLYLDSTHTLVNGFTATREETTLTYTGDTVIPNGGTATMSALLVEDGANDDDADGGAVPIAGRTVHFTLGAGATAQVCDGITNGSGVATCDISPVAQPEGPGTVTGAFTQDNFYQSSSDEAETMIFSFLPTGSFTVGDLSSAPASSVTFWHSEWYLSNGLSGGVAPESFKGFINGLMPGTPMCGGTWTTRQGGNSVEPPPAGSLPAYMGVVVPTGVTKSGNTTSGNIARIVVVQTNGGYAPSPGHPGTGTVVAQYCP